MAGDAVNPGDSIPNASTYFLIGDWIRKSG